MAARRINRKTTPKVRDGKVQRKNRWAWPANYYNTEQDAVVFDRERPGHGYKHLLRAHEVRAFAEELPMWEELSQDLNAIVLARGEDGVMGWHTRGVVAVCAWERAMVMEDVTSAWYEEHRGLLEKLDVPVRREDRHWNLHFDPQTARAFQLVHVLVHELGHHHDRITTRSRHSAARGEGYAETYAVQHEDAVLEVFARHFEL